MLFTDEPRHEYKRSINSHYINPSPSFPSLQNQHLLSLQTLKPTPSLPSPCNSPPPSSPLPLRLPVSPPLPTLPPVWEHANLPVSLSCASMRVEAARSPGSRTTCSSMIAPMCASRRYSRATMEASGFSPMKLLDPVSSPMSAFSWHGGKTPVTH
jgi:hypothetical protein